MVSIISTQTIVLIKASVAFGESHHHYHHHLETFSKYRRRSASPMRIALFRRACANPPDSHRHLAIDIVVDADLALGRMQSVNSTGVLDESALPRDRHGQKQSVESSVVETLADVSASRDDDSLAGSGLFGEAFPGPTPHRRPRVAGPSARRGMRMALAILIADDPQEQVGSCWRRAAPRYRHDTLAAAQGLSRTPRRTRSRGARVPSKAGSAVACRIPDSTSMWR